MKRKYIYLSSKNFDGTVFITQVADWLSVYNENGIAFDYYHLLYYPYLWDKSARKQQLEEIKKATSYFKDYSFCFPSRGLFIYLNAMLWHFKLRRYYKEYDEILLFSRNIFGKEIYILKKLAPIPIIFYYDARAASAEENRYNAVKHKDFSYRKYKTFAHIYYTEYKTVSTADHIFAVSDKLKKYFQINYDISPEKVFIYPCLSDSSKFYFDNEVRTKTRNELAYSNNEQVYLYAGGLSGEYHITNCIFDFFS